MSRISGFTECHLNSVGWVDGCYPTFHFDYFVGLRCRLTQPTSNWGSKLLAGVHLTNQGSTTNPKKSKSGFPPPPCQVSETPELTRVVRQFIEANRAPRDVETDF